MAQQDHANLYAVHDLDFDTLTHFLTHVIGNGVLSGLAVSQRGAGANMSVDVAAGDAMADGTVRNFSSITNVSITAAHGTLPRKDLIVVNSAGSIVTRDGTAEAATPSGEVRRFTLTPSPSDLTDGDLVLAEVWVAAAVTQIFDADISSRTLLAEYGQEVAIPIVMTEGGSTLAPAGGAASGDGPVSIDFEIPIGGTGTVVLMVKNTHATVSSTVALKDQTAGTNRGSVSVPDNTTLYTRFEFSVSGLVAGNNHRIISSLTSSTTLVLINGAKLLL